MGRESSYVFIVMMDFIIIIIIIIIIIVLVLVFWVVNCSTSLLQVILYISVSSRDVCD